MYPEWLERRRKLEHGTTAQWTKSDLCGKRRKYLDALWLLASEDDVLWEYRCHHSTKASFSYAVVLMDDIPGWYDNDENEENEEGGS